MFWEFPRSRPRFYPIQALTTYLYHALRTLFGATSPSSTMDCPTPRVSSTMRPSRKPHGIRQYSNATSRVKASPALQNCSIFPNSVSTRYYISSMLNHIITASKFFATSLIETRADFILGSFILLCLHPLTGPSIAETEHCSPRMS